MSGEATALIALGSNLGDRLGHMRRAALELAGLGEVLALSSLYETEPVGGPAGQQPYLNGVALLAPANGYEEPAALLEGLLALERAHGREREVRWEARTLDLDLLALGDRIVNREGLSVPHPRMMERAFVLAPLLEVAPDWRHPVTGEAAGEALRRTGSSGVVRTGLQWGSR